MSWLKTAMKITMRPLAFCVFAFLCSNATDAAEPEVHVLVPGFQARSLPLRLTNINALAFDGDGRLLAAGYDGRIHRLIDTDGDGLEDKAEPFWDKGTLITPTALVWTEQGLLVASHRKISLLIDADKDGRADREEIVATAWPPILNVGGNVNALGLRRRSRRQPLLRPRHRGLRQRISRQGRNISL